MLVVQRACQDSQRRRSRVESESTCDRCWHQLGVAEGCEIDKPDAVDKRITQVSGDLQRQARLADAARTNQREEPRVALDQERSQGSNIT